MSLYKRISKMFSIQILGQLIIVVEKLIVPPLIITKFGTSGFGEWTLIRSIPMYFQMIDFGFFTISGNKLIEAKSNHDVKTEKQIIANSILFSAIIFIIVLLSAILLYLIDIGKLLNVEHNEYFNMCVLVSFMYVQLYLISQLYFSFLRGVHKHVEASSIITRFKLIELIVMVVSFYFGESFLFTITSILLTRLMSIITLHNAFTKNFSFSILDVKKHIDTKQFVNIVKGGGASSIFSLSQLYSSQLTIILIASLISTSAVGMFQAIKIISGLLVQLSGVFNRTLLSEFCILFNDNKIKLIRSIYFKSQAFLYLVGLIFIFIVYLYSDLIFTMWLGVSSTVLVATNHYSLLTYPIIYNLIFFSIIIYPMTKYFGLYGCGISLLIFETINIIITKFKLHIFWKTNENNIL